MRSLGRKTQSEKSSIFLVLVAAALFGTTGTALAKAPPGSDPLVAGVIRLLIGGAVLVLVGKLHLRSLLGQYRLVMSGALGVGCYQLGFFYATDRTGVAVATVLTIAVSPLVSRGVGFVRRRPAPSPIWNLSAGILLIGILLLCFSKASVDSVQISGVIAAIIAGTSYALYTEQASVLIDRGHQPTAVLGGMFLGAGIMTIPVLFFRPITWVTSSRGVLVLMYLGVITLGVAYVAFGRGLSRLVPTTVIMLTLFEPVIATLLASTVLGEELSRQSQLGMTLILLGLTTVAVTAHSANKRVNDRSEASSG